ncbi:small integral membrane protein 11 isoform X1 [Pongo abelii]|uniref:small integral membrane protein 11 isoform X1 n=1 Tax=Pongo abelii TaxID=9601 RepID=UPI0023E8C8C1|nr:small integral membrane protein 11 isoform X1 [Pongo abelii]
MTNTASGSFLRAPTCPQLQTAARRHPGNSRQRKAEGSRNNPPSSSDQTFQLPGPDLPAASYVLVCWGLVLIRSEFTVYHELEDSAM